MDTLEAIRTRRSCRKYRPEQIEDEKLREVLEAGTYAATGHNTQEPWIVAVQQPEILAQLRRMNLHFWKLRPGASPAEADTDTYYGAPTIILVFAENDNPNAVKDGSLVLGNMMLAAHALGLAACWINREEEMFRTEEGRRLIRRFGLPDGLMGIGALAIGYRDGTPREAKPRKKDYFRIIR